MIRRAVPVAGIFLIAFVATALYAVPLDKFLVMPDELVYSKASLEIWHSPLLVGQGSDWYTSWSQLAQIVYAPAFGLAHTILGAYRIAHLVAAVAMALTAVPAYGLALRITQDRLAGLLVAALCVAVPWMAFSGTLMTEVFAYPAFTWAAWATVRACAEPSGRHDAHALIAAAVCVFARAQLVFVPVAVVVAIVFCAWRARRPLREHRVLLIVVGVLAVLVGLRLAVAGVSGSLGTYASLEDAHSWSIGIAGKLAAYVAVAVGALPLILGIPWMAERLVRRDPPAQVGFAAFSTVSILAVVYQSGLELTQPGRVQDRYLMYAMPLLFTAMAAALLVPRVRVAVIAGAGVVLAMLISRYDFFETGAEIPSLSFTLHKAIGNVTFSVGDRFGMADLSPGTVLAVIVVAVTALLVMSMRWTSPRQRLAIVGSCVLLFCAMETIDAFVQVRHSQYANGYVEPRPRNWLDRIAGSRARVALLVGPASDTLQTPLQWWGAGFWNKSAVRYYEHGTANTASWQQPSTHLLVLDADGRPVDPREWWLISSDDPDARLRSGDIVARAGPLLLVHSTPSAPLRLVR